MSTVGDEVLLKSIKSVKKQIRINTKAIQIRAE